MKQDYFDPQNLLFDQITERGGYVNCLTYPSRARTITPDLLMEKVSLGMTFKAPTALDILQKLSEEQINENIKTTIDSLIYQGCTTIVCCVDLHPSIGKKVFDILKATKEEYYEVDVNIILLGHPLCSTINPLMQDLYKEVASELDVIGSALFREIDSPSQLLSHFDFIFSLSEKNGCQKIQFQTDQDNNPNEVETISLINHMKRNKEQWQNRAYLAYATSTNSFNIEKQRELYDDMVKLGVGVVCCPSAQLATKWNHFHRPGGNSIINLPLMLEHGVTIALGTANILDIHQPFLQGDLGREILTLAEATRFYDIDKLAEIASTNGHKVFHKNY